MIAGMLSTIPVMLKGSAAATTCNGRDEGTCITLRQDIFRACGISQYTRYVHSTTNHKTNHCHASCAS
eukprot:m.435618 g.435618  ORF g.435618 m.435618 type:complete len:68 (+) comp21419_c0_seq106:3837-4040(+)